MFIPSLYSFRLSEFLQHFEVNNVFSYKYVEQEVVHHNGEGGGGGGRGGGGGGGGGRRRWARGIG